jgi:hypothetical protein
LPRPKVRPSRKRNRVLIFSIPLVAVLLVVTVFAANLGRPPLQQCSTPATRTPALDYTISLTVQVENLQGSQTRFIIPPGVGIQGGAWVSHQLDKYGTDGRSPLCTDRPNASGTYAGYNVVHVRSIAKLNFTLGDFFAVWGQPIGPNGTFNSAYVLQKPGYQWQMCIGDPHDTANIKPGNWGNETLVPNKFITLIYFPTSGNGCLG